MLKPVDDSIPGLHCRPKIPHYWKWMNAIDPIAYATRAMAALQFYCEGVDCPTVHMLVPSVTTPQYKMVPQYEYAKDTFGFSYSQRWQYTGYLFAFLVLFRVGGVLALRFINYMKK
eukprot:gb/GECG01002723.1/.p1 GENE.gb/GECG01002723.1/~~gb/GECG01002723.1/.p1  ORF type:complete len:116 (+),score=6.89 gb/GECG01002723.1/:1-348(+)